jgi:PAS domain S-box-containing protein
MANVVYIPNEGQQLRREFPEELKDIQAIFLSTFENAAIGMALVAIDGQILMTNGAFLRLLGYTAEEIVTMTSRELTYPDDVAADVEAMERLLRGEIVAYQIEKRYYHKAGHLVWGQITRSVVRNAHGKPLFYIAQIQDIDERKRIEAEREALIMQLQAALDEVTKLRSILPICSYCKQIRNDADYWQSVESYIEENLGAMLSHSVCPDCYAAHIQPQIDELRAKAQRTPEE